MKNTLLITLLLVFGFTKSQNNDLQINYLTTFENGRVTNNTLKIVDNQSIYGKNLERLKNKIETKVKTNQTDNKLFVTINKPKIIYKNYKEKIMISTERIVLKIFNVKDSLSPMKWKISNEEKEILGYRCKKATTKFRGRNYVAFLVINLKYLMVHGSFLVCQG